MKNYRIYLPAILSCLLMLSCIKEKPVEVIPVTGISFDAEEIDRANTLTIIGIDEQFELSAIVEPANANETLIWEIEDRTTLDVFSINDDLGHQITFKAIEVGETKVTVRTKSGFSRTFYAYSFAAPAKLERIELSDTECTLKIGEGASLAGYKYPEDAEESLVWEIEDESIVEYDWQEDNEFFFSAVKVGTTKIRLSCGDLCKECTVKVLNSTIPLTGIVAVKGNQYSCKEFDRLSIEIRYMPENATNKSTRTIVQDNSILRFDGKSSSTTYDFVALKPGHTKVSIVSVEDSDLKVILDVTVVAAKLPDGAVDMGYRLNNGMPVYFASCNLGATTPAAAGEFYAWGDPEPYYHSMNPWVWKDGKKDGYASENYKYYVKKSKTYTKYVTLPEYGTPDNKLQLDPEDDAAHLTLGGCWQMPMHEDMFWLKTNCNWQNTTRNGIKGIEFISMLPGFEGTTLFLPCNGYITGTLNPANGEFELFSGDRIYMGNYQINQLASNNNHKNMGFVFFDGDIYIRPELRSFGEGIRPVWRGYPEK